MHSSNHSIYSPNPPHSTTSSVSKLASVFKLPKVTRARLFWISSTIPVWRPLRSFTLEPTLISSFFFSSTKAFTFSFLSCCFLSIFLRFSAESILVSLAITGFLSLAASHSLVMACSLRPSSTSLLVSSCVALLFSSFCFILSCSSSYFVFDLSATACF